MEGRACKSRDVKAALRSLGTPEKAASSAWFFKTGKGHYGEGDIFLGVTVPEQRRVAKQFRDLPLTEIEILLHSKEHECRLTALFILVGQFERADEKERKAIYTFYLKNTAWVNNWDLVDSSAPRIVGMYLMDKNRSVLVKLAHSKSLWERRIAIVATLAFIVKGESEDALKIAELLLGDTHDLIHKASGWMLREVLKRNDGEAGIAFLDAYHRTMPRTMLRYAIERLSPAEKAHYMAR